MSQSFIKTIEDFVCLHCGQQVVGNGYTNHCPQCLWSRHVDVQPGDRSAQCGSMMVPVEIVGKKGQFRIIHRCEQCGYEKINDASPADEIGQYWAGML